MTEIEVDIDFVQMAKDVACIKQAVMGNGEKGLCKRVEELECSENRYGRLMGLIGGLGAVIGGAVSYFANWFKG